MIEADALLDTNVLLRHLLQDHPDHSLRASAVIATIERGGRAVRLADTVVFEAAFTLEKTYRAPRVAIRDALQPILELPGCILPGKRIYDEVFDLYVREAGLSCADCYHIALAKQLALNCVLSFDRKIERVQGITRLEP